MTARICRGSDSLSVLVAGAAEVLERCETEEPVIDRSRRAVPGAGVVAASFCVVYVDSDRRVAWLRGRS